MDLVIRWMRTDQGKGDEAPSVASTSHTRGKGQSPLGPHCTGRLAASPGSGQGALCVSLPLELWEAPVTEFCSRRGCQGRASEVRTPPNLPVCPSALCPAPRPLLWQKLHRRAQCVLCWLPGYGPQPLPQSCSTDLLPPGPRAWILAMTVDHPKWWPTA